MTGTDTGVGKTIFSAYLTKCSYPSLWGAGDFPVSVGAKYWKPIQCGQPFDEDQVKELVAPEFVHPGVYQLKAALSPHQAAELEGVELKMAQCAIPVGDVVVEGAGGVYVPITWESLMVDLMSQLGLPIILVARSSLGTLNHSLLSVRALRSCGLTIKALVMVGPPNERNRQSLERLSGLSVFEFPWLKSLEEEFKSLDFQKGYNFFWRNHG